MLTAGLDPIPIKLLCRFLRLRARGVMQNAVNNPDEEEHLDPIATKFYFLGPVGSGGVINDGNDN